MKCHYEVLSVARDADDAEIKSAYRKLALRWHPDKNPNNAEEAKQQFQILQQAYEILSDPHERSWYDNHREHILRGKQSDYEDNSLDVFQYFTVSCFRGYGDDPGGFYSVYGEVFKKIIAEDAEFMDDEEEVEKIPLFGSSISNFDEVVGPFYAYWQSYCTKKSYAWLCPYNIQEIKDRRILREIEKDMKKVTQKARKERNEEVRHLVAFVKKRDKRMHAYKKMLEERATENRKKQEMNRIEQIRKRNQEIRQQQTSDILASSEYEDQLRELEQQYYESKSEDSDTELSDNELSEEGSDLLDGESAYFDDFYCVACNRSFKNPNAMLNHDASKKHSENIEKLVKQMQLENQSPEKNSPTKDELDNSDASTNANLEIDHNVKVNSELNNVQDVCLDSDPEELPIENVAPKLKTKKNKKSKRNQVLDEDDHSLSIPDVLGNISGHDDDDWATGNGKKSNKKSKKPSNQKKVNINEKQVPDTVTEMNATTTVTTTNKDRSLDDVDVDHTCVTCKSNFDSKNKLFTHLKKTGHGVYIPKEKDAKKDSPAGTSSRRKKKNAAH